MTYDPQQHLKILHWAEEDRPREKLLLKGKATLSDAELIGILLGSGTTSMTAVDLAKHILHSVDYNLNELAKMTVKDLMKFKGIGEAKAVSIVSALELGRRRKDQEMPEKRPVRGSKDLYTAMIPHMLDLPTEEFWIIHLSRSNQILKKERISIGGLAGTVVDKKVIYKSAIQNLSSFIVAVHNHPSGNLKPSHQDVQLTKELAQCGLLLGIPMIDHIIFTDDGYFSFADEGMM